MIHLFAVATTVVTIQNPEQAASSLCNAFEKARAKGKFKAIEEKKAEEGDA